MVVGIFAALALTRALSSAGMLVSVKATDPVTYLAITVFFTAIAAIACWIPARAGTRVDPNVALRASS